MLKPSSSGFFVGFTGGVFFFIEIELTVFESNEVSAGFVVDLFGNDTGEDDAEIGWLAELEFSIMVDSFLDALGVEDLLVFLGVNITSLKPGGSGFLACGTGGGVDFSELVLMVVLL